jgi:hypothetical protein
MARTLRHASDVKALDFRTGTRRSSERKEEASETNSIILAGLRNLAIDNECTFKK